MGTSSYAGETKGCGPKRYGPSSEDDELDDLREVLWAEAEGLLLMGDETYLDDLLKMPIREQEARDVSDEKCVFSFF